MKLIQNNCRRSVMGLFWYLHFRFCKDSINGNTFPCFLKSKTIKRTAKKQLFTPKKLNYLYSMNLKVLTGWTVPPLFIASLSLRKHRWACNKRTSCRVTSLLFSEFWFVDGPPAPANPGGPWSLLAPCWPACPGTWACWGCCCCCWPCWPTLFFDHEGRPEANIANCGVFDLINKRHGSRTLE